MSEQASIEEQVRGALAERADGFPYAPAEERLTRVDYRPRYHRPRTPTRLLGALSVSASAVVAAVIGVLLVAGGSPAPALAGWTPVPKALSSSALTTIEREVLDHWAPRCSGPGGSIVLADVRGPYTFALYVTDAAHPVNAATLCVDGKERGSSVLIAGRPWPPPIAEDRARDLFFEQSTLKQADSGPGNPYVFIQVGRAGADVRSVSVLLSNGRRVRATVSHGWYVVWWPELTGFPAKTVVTTGAAGSGARPRTYEVPAPGTGG